MMRLKDFEEFWASSYDSIEDWIASKNEKPAHQKGRAVEGVRRVKCECGAEYTELKIHSDWCPKAVVNAAIRYKRKETNGDD